MPDQAAELLPCDKCGSLLRRDACWRPIAVPPRRAFVLCAACAEALSRWASRVAAGCRRCREAGHPRGA